MFNKDVQKILFCNLSANGLGLLYCLNVHNRLLQDRVVVQLHGMLSAWGHVRSRDLEGGSVAHNRVSISLRLCLQRVGYVGGCRLLHLGLEANGRNLRSFKIVWVGDQRTGVKLIIFLEVEQFSNLVESFSLLVDWLGSDLLLESKFGGNSLSLMSSSNSGVRVVEKIGKFVLFGKSGMIVLERNVISHAQTSSNEEASEGVDVSNVLVDLFLGKFMAGDVTSESLDDGIVDSFGDNFRL